MLKSSNHIGGVMISMLVSSGDHGFKQKIKNWYLLLLCQESTNKKKNNGSESEYCVSGMT